MQGIRDFICLHPDHGGVPHNIQRAIQLLGGQLQLGQLGEGCPQLGQQVLQFERGLMMQGNLACMCRLQEHASYCIRSLPPQA